MSAVRALVALLLVIVVAVASLLAWATPATLGTVDSSPAKVDPALVAKGAKLALLGDCLVCHTAPDGKPYAGGRPLQTPFGTIYGTNITPDRETGIGTWSEAAFIRAMREGVDRAGRHLYPAFPYDHFREIADEDLHALYAYLSTRDPVSSHPPPNRVRFPFNLRPLIAVWKLLFLHRGRYYHPDPAQGPEWNRGAYLVATLGHCGACHTPRNRLGAERLDQELTGGEAEGWHAPALDRLSPAPVPWRLDDLFAYLRGTMAPRHDVAGGPMAAVVHNLSSVPESDVRSIATYVASLAAPASHEVQARAAQALRRAERDAGADADSGTPGARIYAGACASCHEEGRGASSAGALPLALSSAVTAPKPTNFVQIVVHGITPPNGEAGAWMPSFGGAFTDAQLADLAAYVRSRFSDKPAWEDLTHEVEQVKAHPEG